MVQKIYSKVYLVSCTNTHRYITDSVNHGMVMNTKTWISWEQNIIFPRNKKIINLCPRWHILRSYRFVAEVTFKWCMLTNVKSATNVHPILPKNFIYTIFSFSQVYVIQNNSWCLWFCKESRIWVGKKLIPTK